MFAWYCWKTATEHETYISPSVPKCLNCHFQLEINATDYFQNVLNINKLYRTDWTNLLKDGEDRTKWRGNTYATFAQFYYPWNELLVPAGILQWPVYDYHIPHFLNFGSMGSVIAHMYVHSIDYNGKHGILMAE